MSVSLREFYSMLENHDWYFDWSDDMRVYRAGKESLNKLISLSQVSPKHRELFQDFESYMFTGEPWGDERSDRPKIPD